MQHGSYVWDDAGVPPGELVITIDLAAQTLSVFRGGYEIGAAVIIYGATDKPTPTGTFPISQKKRHHISNLYGAPMPYMLRLTNDGVAIHASDVQWATPPTAASAYPPEFAALLFEQAQLGTKVIVTDGKRMALPSMTRPAAASRRSQRCAAPPAAIPFLPIPLFILLFPFPLKLSFKSSLSYSPLIFSFPSLYKTPFPPN